MVPVELIAEASKERLMHIRSEFLGRKKLLQDLISETDLKIDKLKATYRMQIDRLKDIKNEQVTS